jgi:tetratricopeptide (TPR) repeat protein
LALFLALLYKEMALTFPLLAIAADFVGDEDVAGLVPRARWGRWSSLAIVLGGYVALRVHALGSLMGTPQHISIGPLDRVSTSVYLLALYLWKLLLPFGQNAYYVFRPFSQLSIKTWGPPILLLLFCAWLAWRHRADTKLLYLAGWVVITLAPVLSLGSVGQNVFAERYLYIPSLGFCLLLPAVAERCLNAGARAKASIGVAAIVAGFALLSLYRNPVWQDNETFYSQTVAASPDAAMMHQNLGVVWYQKGNHQASLQQFEAALEAEAHAFIHSPRDRYNALIGLSTIHLDAGRLEQAWQIAIDALAINTEWEEAYRVLGTIRSRQSRDDEAEELLSRAVALKPSDVIARINLGSVLIFRKKPLEAESQFRAALAYDSRSVPAHLGAAMSAFQLGRRADAIEQVKEVLRIEPGNRDAIGFLRQLESASPP